MYESHFGLTASPFQLNPDPSFYFDSKGHSNALAYLRYGAYQGEGFIVVTGEIGAGKTTLVRALLSELDSSKIVAGQVVSTQLEAGDLLRSILTAFGVQSSSSSKATLIASLEAFLTLVATRGQRALLIVDEAQNLNREAVEELRMLSNFQFGHHALLQSFLVGQPDLRRLLQSPSMEQLRQRVIASCHLGPLDAGETHAYIEHRLRHVGWQERPRFEPTVFDAIHRATGGIPRRINQLCNRLLLGAYLGNEDDITVALVDRVVDELRGEQGTPLPHATLPAPPATHGTGSARAAAGDVVRVQRTEGATLSRPVLCVASTTLDFLKARALAASLEVGPDALASVIVTPHERYEFGSDEPSLASFGQAALEVHLGAPREAGAESSAVMLSSFGELIAELAPRAVVVLGDSDAALMCSLAANHRGVPVMHAEGRARTLDARQPSALNGALIDRIASLTVTSRVSDHATLSREGIPAERVLRLGSLLSNVVHQFRSAAPAVEDIVERFGISPAIVRGTKGFGVATLRIADGQLPDERIVDLIGGLGDLPPLLWLVDGATDDAIRAAGLARAFDDAHVVLLPSLALPDAVALLSNSAFLLCDSDRHLADAAEALNVACLELGTAGSPTKALRKMVAGHPHRASGGPAWDGGPGRRIADRIRRWVPS